MNQIGGSRTDTLVKLVLIFFISLLSFSVGTFVGKEFSDKKHRLASVESEYGSNPTAAHGNEKNFDTAPDEALSDEDIARLSEEFIKAENSDLNKPHASEGAADGEKKVAVHKEEVHPSAHGKEMHSSGKDHKGVSAGATDVVPKTAQRVAHGQSPVAIEKKVVQRTPTSLPQSVASSTVGQYTVQVASYSTQEEAEEHVKKLKSKGFSAFVIPAEIRGKTWHRVSVGVYASREEASQFRRRLLKQAKLTSAIVQKIGNF